MSAAWLGMSGNPLTKRAVSIAKARRRAVMACGKGGATRPCIKPANHASANDNQRERNIGKRQRKERNNRHNAFWH